MMNDSQIFIGTPVQAGVPEFSKTPTYSGPQTLMT